MPKPLQLTLTSLTPGVTSIAANWTNPSVADTDELYFMYRVFGTATWTYLLLPTPSVLTYTIASLLGNTTYEIAVKASSNTFGAGPMSNVLRATTTASALGLPVIQYGENSIVSSGGAGTQLVQVTNTGTNGDAEYNLDTLIGTASQLTAQVRNGRPCWQSGGGSPNGITTSPTPPTAKYSQPCTIYVGITLFFVDATYRWVLSGNSIKPSIKVSTAGWKIEVGGTSIGPIGAAVADGRMYIIEAQINGASSKFRIVDELGADSGEVTGTLTSTNLDIEAMTWNVAATANEDLPCQIYETLVFGNIGSSGSRSAKRSELFQKWLANQADVVYPAFPPEPIFTQTLTIGGGLHL